MTSEVDLVVGHASATPVGDLSEARAINAIGTPAVTAVKGSTGHLIGAAGALNAAVAALAVGRGAIPPTVGFADRDPELDLDIVTDRPARARSAPRSRSPEDSKDRTLRSSSGGLNRV